jgi:hypothetical protein
LMYAMIFEQVRASFAATEKSSTCRRKSTVCPFMVPL